MVQKPTAAAWLCYGAIGLRNPRRSREAKRHSETGEARGSMSKVLVTGGSGFVGSRCILQLLAAGHEVHTTVRNLGRESEMRALLGRAGYAGPAERMTFFAADLQSDSGWPQAAAGCDYVLHVASPFPATVPRNEDELIRPARDGALRVLRAARDSGVRRVVLTSSFAAIGYGHPERTAPFDEASWTNLGGRKVLAYHKSKTLAERAAWEFVAAEGRGLELAVVNPSVIFGPVMAAYATTSILLVKRLMEGAVPGCPQACFGLVDVRDVADLHLRAMTSPAASGERFLAVAGDFLTVGDLARVLKAQLGESARRVPTRSLPNWLVRFSAPFDPSVKLLLPDLGIRRSATSEKARRMLGWAPRSNQAAIVATAHSLLQLGLVGDHAVA